MIRKIFIIPVLFLFILISCEKVVDINVPSIAPKLIIDASFEVYFDQIPITSKTIVKLRQSADYFEESIPIVTNATVFITNMNNNSIINFSDSNLDGNYEPITTFIPQENIEYELTVVYKNETYKGKAKRIKSNPFINVEQGNETLFTGKEIQLKIDFRDVGPEENFYLFDFTNNLYTTLEDRFFNDSDYNFSFFYQEDDIELPSTVTLKMSSISKDYYTYFRVLINQSGQNSGGPFETVPSSLLGNMINTTNKNNFPLGYFHISETDTFTLTLVEKD